LTEITQAGRDIVYPDMQQGRQDKHQQRKGLKKSKKSPVFLGPFSKVRFFGLEAVL